VSKKTRATEWLEKRGITFSVHTYNYDPDADSIGRQAAEALGEPPQRVLKTLMALVDGQPVCAVVPSDCELSMKKLAATFRGKSAQMMKAADAERTSGYAVGGISPFGQKRQVPIVIEEQALTQEFVFINGGQRGLQVRLDPRLALQAVSGKAAAVIA
jgi:Cys-tRNA(Pro)/Cys-tRNA(Cys) deacylase